MNLNDIHDSDFRWLCEKIVDAMERFRVPGVAVEKLTRF